MKDILFREYMDYRTRQRGFDKGRIEEILRYSSERYYDRESGRKVAVGLDRAALIAIPYEETVASIIPITVHATSRQQIRFRLNTGRFTYE